MSSYARERPKKTRQFDLKNLFHEYSPGKEPKTFPGVLCTSNKD